MNVQSFFLNHETILLILKISATLLVTIILNTILRAFIRVPKKIETARAETFVNILRNILSVVIYAVAINYVLGFLNINIAPILASAGIMGVVLGFGAKPFIEDIIGGLFLFTQSSISIGDYVVIGEIEGYIESIGIRTLSVRGETGALHILPNSMVKLVSNYSRGRAHVYIDIPVKSDQPIEKVLKMVTKAVETLREDKKVGVYIASDSKVLGIEHIKEGSIMIVRTDLVTHTSMRWSVSKEFRLLVKKAFEKEKLVFA